MDPDLHFKFRIQIRKGSIIKIQTKTNFFNIITMCNQVEEKNVLVSKYLNTLKIGENRTADPLFFITSKWFQINVSLWLVQKVRFRPGSGNTSQVASRFVIPFDIGSGCNLFGSDTPLHTSNKVTLDTINTRWAYPYPMTLLTTWKILLVLQAPLPI